jgi:hypothetical protein
MRNKNIKYTTAIFKFIREWVNYLFFVPRSSFYSSIKLIAYILVGSVIIYPLVTKIPLLGWDWFYFFNANNPIFNIYLKSSAYPPFTRYIIQLLTWMDWRSSLGILNSITIMTISLATWKNGGRYKEIVLALTTPPLWFLMWIGHPDGLVLLGLITGIIPLILMKPILTIFGLLHDRKLFAWSVVFCVLSIIVWPNWIFSLQNATISHEVALGWANLGWPLLIIGFIFIIGAGKDPYMLMSAGCFITPYLMPYHMAIILPAIGKTRGWRQILLWISSWFVFLGTGLPEKWHIISLIFPLVTYCMCGTIIMYKENVKDILDNGKYIFHRLWHFKSYFESIGNK